MQPHQRGEDCKNEKRKREGKKGKRKGERKWRNKQTNKQRDKRYSTSEQLNKDMQSRTVCRLMVYWQESVTFIWTVGPARFSGPP